jgi:hypothetical protein
MRTLTAVALALAAITAPTQPSVGLRLTYQVAGQSASTFWQGALARAAGSEPHTPEKPLVLRQTYRYQLEQAFLQNAGATLLLIEWGRWQADAASELTIGCF